MQLQQETSASPFVSHNFSVVVILVITRRTALHCSVLGSDAFRLNNHFLVDLYRGEDVKIT